MKSKEEPKTFKQYLEQNPYQDTRSFTKEDWESSMLEKWEDLHKKEVYTTDDFVNDFVQIKTVIEKKYTEEDLHTILRLRKEWYSHTDKNVVRDFIKLLNKQD